MHSISLLALSVLLGMTIAAPLNNSSSLLQVRNPADRKYHIPDNHASGVYSVYLDAQGKEVHTRSGSLSDPSHEWLKNLHQSKKAHARDDKHGANCVDDNEILDAQEVQRAAFSLGARCDANGNNWVAHRSDRYAIAGNTVVFICNFQSEGWYGQKNDRGCSTEQIVNALHMVESKDHCDGRQGYDAEWDSTYAYSIGVISKGKGFCSFVSST